MADAAVFLHGLNLGTLPTELKQLIFVHLPTISSVRALALSSSSLFHAFSSAESLIARQVLQNEIGLEFLREALVVRKTSGIKKWRKEQVRVILREYFDINTPIRVNNWTFSQAQLLTRLKDRIDSFVADFASRALSLHPITQEQGQVPTPPSSSELIRFGHNFWKFELFCNLFRLPNQYCGVEERFRLMSYEESSLTTLRRLRMNS